MGHVNSPQTSQPAAASTSTAPKGPATAASVSTAAQSAEALFSAAGPEQAFHFSNEDVTSTAAGKPEELSSDLHAGLPELTAILQASPAAVDEHANVHINNGQHHALGHSHDELLP